MDYKICRHCNKQKQSSEFYKSRRKCKKCCNEDTKLRRRQQNVISENIFDIETSKGFEIAHEQENIRLTDTFHSTETESVYSEYSGYSGLNTEDIMVTVEEYNNNTNHRISVLETLFNKKVDKLVEKLDEKIKIFEEKQLKVQDDIIRHCKSEANGRFLVVEKQQCQLQTDIDRLSAVVRVSTIESENFINRYNKEKLSAELLQELQEKVQIISSTAELLQELQEKVQYISSTAELSASMARDTTQLVNDTNGIITPVALNTKEHTTQMVQSINDNYKKHKNNHLFHAMVGASINDNYKKHKNNHLFHAMVGIFVGASVLLLFNIIKK